MVATPGPSTALASAVAACTIFVSAFVKPSWAPLALREARTTPESEEHSEIAAIKTEDDAGVGWRQSEYARISLFVLVMMLGLFLGLFVLRGLLVRLLRKKPRCTDAVLGLQTLESASIMAESGKKDSEIDPAIVAKVPSPTRSPKKSLSGRLSDVKSERELQMEEDFFQGQGVDDVEHADRLLKEKCINSDAGAFVIFEDEVDELRHHKRRSHALDCFVRAFGRLRQVQADNDRLQDAGSALLDDIERLQHENRQLIGDVAYWREMAEGDAFVVAATTPREEASPEKPVVSDATRSLFRRRSY